MNHKVDCRQIQPTFLIPCIVIFAQYIRCHPIKPVCSAAPVQKNAPSKVQNNHQIMYNAPFASEHILLILSPHHSRANNFNEVSPQAKLISTASQPSSITRAEPFDIFAILLTAGAITLLHCQCRKVFVDPYCPDTIFVRFPNSSPTEPHPCVHFHIIHL